MPKKSHRRIKRYPQSKARGTDKRDLIIPSLSICVAILAILSNVLITYINNRHTERLQIQALTHEQKTYLASWEQGT